MERILVILAFFFCLSAIGATPGNAPILTIAAPGQQTQALSIPLSCLASGGGCPTQVFSLYAGGSGTWTAGNYYPFFRNGASSGSVGYKVGDQTGSYGTVKAYCLNTTAAAGAASDAYSLISATASFAGNASSITGGIGQGGGTGIYVNETSATALVPATVPGTYVFGASTYPGIQIGASTTYYIHLECFEQ